MLLCDKIKVLRKAKSLTQSQLAETLDVTRQSVQKWESGVTSPDISKLPELAAFLGVSTDILLDNSISEKEMLFEALSRSGKCEQEPQKSNTEQVKCGTEQNSAILTVSTEKKSENTDKNSAEKALPVKQRSMVDWLILIPVLLGVCVLIFMFYVFGAMLIGFGFIFSLFSAVGSVWSVVAIFFNAANGAGAILIAVGGVFLGAGLCFPLCYLSVLWLKVYRKLAKKLAAKIKKFDIRRI